MGDYSSEFSVDSSSKSESSNLELENEFPKTIHSSMLNLIHKTI